MPCPLVGEATHDIDKLIAAHAPVLSLPILGSSSHCAKPASKYVPFLMERKATISARGASKSILV